MNKIHVVMPFHRRHLIEDLVKVFGKERLNLLVTPEQFIDWNKGWPTPIVVSVPTNKRHDLCYHKINYFIRTKGIIDNDYYWGMCDDDSVEENVIPAIQEMNDDIIFISMKRGDNIVTENLSPTSWHPTNTLIACPELSRPYDIGLEQMIIKGHIFKRLIYNVNSSYADGLMGAELSRHYKVRYEPDLFVLFNWFQEGRWNK
jgi:hypothetical protein